MSTLRLENVEKIYRKGVGFTQVEAVNGVDLNVKDGEFIVILGPSGAGKTVLLRLIAGLEGTDKGDIYIGGELINDLPPGDRNVAMVFQDYALYPHMNAFENIAFGLRNLKIPEEIIRKKIDEVAEFLKIKHLLGRMPKTLSGGEKQRVALGRAIVKSPRVFLMDEPLANLDAKLRREMQMELRKIHQKLKVTTLYVTHDQAEAMTLGERIAVMHQGKIFQVDAPNSLYQHPKNKFIASFVGEPSTNFFEASLIEKEGVLLADTGDFVLPLPDGVAEMILKNSSGPDISLGFRPEDISVSPKQDSRKENIFSAKVEGFHAIGSFNLVHLNFGQNLATVLSLGINVKLGDFVFASFNVDKMHVFDTRNGETIV